VTSHEPLPDAAARAVTEAAVRQTQGRLAEAEALYVSALRTEPDHVGALHGLGLLRAQQGRFDEAAALIRQALAREPLAAEMLNDLGVVMQAANRHDDALVPHRQAIALRPGFARAHYNLATALQALGRLDEALEPYRTAVALEPGLAEAHHNLGVALAAQGRHAEAAPCFAQALAIRPDVAETHHHLGRTFAALSRVEDAVACFGRAVALRPDFPDALIDWGGLLHGSGRIDAAVACFEKALAVRPDDVIALNGLGCGLLVLKRTGAAMTCFERILALRPDHAEAHNNLGVALVALGRRSEAIACYEGALAIDPMYGAAASNLGNALMAERRETEALVCYERALANGTDDPELYQGAAAALGMLGRFDEARRAIEVAVELAPRRVEFYVALAYLKRFADGDPHVAAMEAIARDTRALSEPDRASLHFALAKAYADLGQHERSFAQLLTANELKRRHTAYDEAETLGRFDRIRAVFTPAMMVRLRGLGAASPVPLFIVGMPRSGTTLVEQILASHPEVFGAGELEDFRTLVAGLSHGPGDVPSVRYPELAAGLDAAQLRELGASYLQRIRALAPNAARITDKLPINFAYVGLIHLALPDARIIHVRRDPIDTCLSCFSNRFLGDTQPFSRELGELGRYYRAYEAVMAHWRTVLPPGIMLEVRYEDVVDDLEAQARRMLDHSGLAWDPACLTFHATERTVRTASATQVRQPIYRSSIARWRPYANLLTPLLDALGIESAGAHLIDSEPPGGDGARSVTQAAMLRDRGQFAEAEALYLSALKTQGDDVEALHGLGLLRARQGRLDEAATLMRQALARDPNSAERLNDLGTVMQAANRHDEALACHRQAIVLRPDFARAHYNLAAALQALGRLDEALPPYRTAIDLDPGFAEAHHNLGVALAALGRHEDAAACFARALAIRPDAAATHHHLGRALATRGRFDEAVACFERAIAIRPDLAEALSDLGDLLHTLGRLEAAVACFEKALAARPDDVGALNGLGCALADLKREGEALHCFARVLALRPDDAEAHNNLGNALAALDRRPEAIVCYRRALAINPGYGAAHSNLGNALMALRREAEAVACYERALASGCDVKVYGSVAAALRMLGRLDEGRRAIEIAVELAPRRAEFYTLLAESKRFTDGDPHLALMEAAAQDIGSLSEKDQTSLNFALAKAYADLGQHERSFKHLLAANALSRRSTNYDETAKLGWFEQIASAFTPALMERLRGLGAASPVPVFIVGMPRSGSTLVEQILASHPAIFGAGELDDFRIVVAHLMPDYPELAAGLDGAQLLELGTAYLERVRALAPDAARITDKLPINFAYVGLIHLALPGARIIHVRRDPIDTCLSCFSKQFIGDHPYNNDLGELGRYYGAYQAVMAHWRAVLPAGVMLEVNYEDVVDDLEKQARRLVAHCGLSWDPACLVFHTTQRAVRTASAAQVRQPIYRNSVARWRPYAHLLTPLLDALGIERAART